MKFVSLVFGLCASRAAATGVRGAAGAKFVAEKSHGFADADPDSDASLDIIRHHKLHSRHGDHRTLQKSAGESRSGDLQREVEQLVTRVGHLQDREASAEFAKELVAMEEELGSSTEGLALAEEVGAVHAELCTRDDAPDGGIVGCDTFMSQACSRRPLQVASHFCSKFFRQRKHGRGSGGATVDDAVRLTASTDGDGAGVADGVAANADTNEAANAVSAAEQYAAAPVPAGGPAPAPGPVPMGPFFGGKVVRPLPDQGFDGELDQYKDRDQQVENWQLEFGPKAGHRDFKKICADFKANEWCRLHGYHGKTGSKTIIEEIIEEVDPAAAGSGNGPKSSAARRSFAAVFSIALVAASALSWP